MGKDKGWLKLGGNDEKRQIEGTSKNPGNQDRSLAQRKERGKLELGTINSPERTLSLNPTSMHIVMLA